MNMYTLLINRIKVVAVDYLVIHPLDTYSISSAHSLNIIISVLNIMYIYVGLVVGDLINKIV